MPSIQPFQIAVPDSAIDALKHKLSLTHFPDEIDEAAWDYGSPLSDIRRLTNHWLYDFDWRKQEAALNRLPQFTTEIQADGFDPLNIHFIHQRSEVKAAIPLLFVHGWPGHFLEVTKILPELVKGGEDGAPAFHVVALSLPGYAFSEGSKKRGFGLPQYAETCNKLMLKLGYDKYVSQGGDWGFYITRTIDLLYPNHCKASHVNMDHGTAPNWGTMPFAAAMHAVTPYTEREKKGLQRSKWFLDEGSGYRALQTTKPQTLGYGLADSPVALLAWIYEKLHDWTDDYPWTDEQVCTWISLYWFSTSGPAASARIYYESVHSTSVVTRERLTQWIPGVKLGMSHFPQELRVLPKAWTRTLGPVVFERDHESGGHFAAWERPEAIVGDVRTMFGKGGGAYGVIGGKEGYDLVSSRL